MSTLVARPGARPSILPIIAPLAALSALSAAVALDRGVDYAAMACLAVGFLALFGRSLTRWHAMLGTVLLIILFVPIKRYTIAANLPFDLELYRVAVAAVIVLWTGALLADRRIRLRGTVLDGPLLLFGVAVLGSIVTNVDTITGRSLDAKRAAAFAGVIVPDLSSEVMKAALFLVSFYLVYYFIASTIRDPRAVDALVKVLVAGCTVVAVGGIVERRTGYNVFNHLPVPFSSYLGDPELDTRGASRLRVYGSAQSPIALAALGVMVIPLAAYLAKKTRNLRWAVAGVVIGLGAAASVSRTSVTMLVTVGLVLLFLRKLNFRAVAIFALPALLVIHLAVPGAIGGLQSAFFPPGGLIAEQTQYKGRASGERVGPQIRRIEQQPAFGVGYGTRITTGPLQNALVLDNQWLATAVDTGLVGFAAWIWFFARFIRRIGWEAKRDRSDRGFLLAAMTGSVTAFAVGMLTYDAFSFIQVTFVMYVIAALAATTMRYGKSSRASPA